MTKLEELARILDPGAWLSLDRQWPEATNGAGFRRYRSLEAAKRLLTALLPPNERMIEAGADNVVGCCMPSPKEAREIFTAMIQSILNEGEG